MEIIPIPAKKKTLNITKAGIYARVSTSRAEQLRSLSSQVSALTQYVYDRYDWVLRDVYIDVGSAKTGSSRREFERMIEDCKSGKLDYILVKSPSRFGRDSLEVIESVRAILDAGVKLYFEANDLKIESVYDELPLTIANAINQAENEQRSGNIKLGLKHRAETGDSGLYSRPCYGYKKNEEGKLVPDPDQAAVVSKIYTLYLDGKSFSGIIEELAAEHIPSPRGSERWSKKAIETILTNVKYPGHVEILKTDPGRNSYYIRNAHDEVVYGDSGYLGIEKREEIVSDEHLSKIDYRINRRPSRLQKVSENVFDWDQMIERSKLSVRCKVEHPFRTVKCLFEYRKTVYKGLSKNENRLYALFVSANLYALASRGRSLSIAW